MLRLRVLVVVCVMLGLLAGGRAVCADTLRDEAARITCDVPAGWKRLPEAAVRKMEETIRSSGVAAEYKGAIRVIALYSRDGKNTTLPFIMVEQVASDTPMEGSFDQIAKGFMGGVKDKVNSGSVVRSSKGTVQSVSVGEFVLDDQNYRVTNCLESVTAGVPVRTTMVNCLGTDGFIGFALYSKAEQAKTDAAVLDSILASFRFDPGAGFVPKARALTEHDFSYRMGQIAACVFLLVIILFVIKKARGR